MDLGTILFTAIPRVMLSILNASDDMMELGTKALPIISTSFVFVGLSYICCGYLEALGKGTYSLIIALMRQLIIVLPLAYILSNSIGIVGVWIAFPIAEVITALASILIFRYVNKSSEVFAQFEKEKIG